VIEGSLAQITSTIERADRAPRAGARPAHEALAANCRIRGQALTGFGSANPDL
jgi:hypothetical protein